MPDSIEIAPKSPIDSGFSNLFIKSGELAQIQRDSYFYTNESTLLSHVAVNESCTPPRKHVTNVFHMFLRTKRVAGGYANDNVSTKHTLGHLAANQHVTLTVHTVKAT